MARIESCYYCGRSEFEVPIEVIEGWRMDPETGYVDSIAVCQRDYLVHLVGVPAEAADLAAAELSEAA